MCRLAMISAHGCPLAPLGGKETGGMNVYVREVALALGQRSMSVDVFTRLTDPSLPRIVQFGENVRVIHLPAGKVGALDKNEVLDHLPEFVHYVRSFCQEHGLTYRLAHSHYWLSAWVGSILARQWHVPHVAMYHTLGSVKNNARDGENETERRIAVERRTMASADTIIASSEHERQQMIALYGAGAERITVVPCGVDLDMFRPMGKAAAREELGLDSAKVLVFVGRMQPLKGIDVLLRALALLGDRHNYRLLVVGGSLDEDGELRRLSKLAGDIGISARVSFVGAQAQDKLPVYYSAADACVVPSHYESFGLVALEALACGTPVIAARVGGLPTVVRDGENGLLAPWRTPDAFARLIDRVLSDHALHHQLSKAARRSVAQLTWDSVAERLLSLYDQLAESAPLRQACLCGR